MHEKRLLKTVVGQDVLFRVTETYDSYVLYQEKGKPGANEQLQ